MAVKFIDMDLTTQRDEFLKKYNMTIEYVNQIVSSIKRRYDPHEKIIEYMRARLKDMNVQVSANSLERITR